jgi:hypothetical protein
VILLRIKQIAALTLFAIFTIIITCLALYFQWGEFYEGYSYSNFNLFVSIIFLSAWLLFSFYIGGRIQEKIYQKFIIVYWGIGIITSIFIRLFANNQSVQSYLFPFYIWCGGPLYGFRYIFFSIGIFDIDVPSLILITSPLGILSCFIGYWLGCWSSKLQES